MVKKICPTRQKRKVKKMVKKEKEGDLHLF